MIDSEWLSLLKALADGTRLRLVGLLADHEHTVEQLAALLDLTAPTISHHLARLSDAGLVSARADGYYSVFRLESQRLESLAAILAEPTALTEFAEGIDRGAYDRRVLGSFLREDGSLKEIPPSAESAASSCAISSIPSRRIQATAKDRLTRSWPDFTQTRRCCAGNWLD